MDERILRSNFYKKIAIHSNESRVGINCEDGFEFLYEMKDVAVQPLIDYHDINDDLLEVNGIKHESCGKKIIELHLSIKNSYFTLKEDFSNIIEISDKFNLLLEELSKSFEWQQLFFGINFKLNCIKLSEYKSQKIVTVYVKRFFEDFYNLEKYDLIVTEKTTKGSNNKIMFDGEILETDKHVIRFVNKPKFDKFTVNLDNRINELIFSIPSDQFMPEMMSHHVPENNKYNIYFDPSRVESFIYLNLLEDISWVDEGYNNYSETDILAKTYNF